MRQCLYKYTDDELSLLVFNTEYLYNMRQNPKSLIRELRASYRFTNKQLEVLKTDLRDEDQDPNAHLDITLDTKRGK